MKKTISMLLALVMVLGLLPAAVFATGTNNVYISVSFDGRYPSWSPGHWKMPLRPPTV